MKISEAEQNSGISRKLILAVIRQLGGRESLEDIRNHGIDGGFRGFIYYTDTVAFFKRNRREIVSLVESMAQDLGESPVDMVAGFQCLAGREIKRHLAGVVYERNHYESDNRRLLNEYAPSVSRCLYGGRLTDEDDTVANALSWFAAEEVARAFEPRD